MLHRWIPLACSLNLTFVSWLNCMLYTSFLSCVNVCTVLSVEYLFQYIFVSRRKLTDPLSMSCSKHNGNLCATHEFQKTLGLTANFAYKQNFVDKLLGLF